MSGSESTGLSRAAMFAYAFAPAEPPKDRAADVEAYLRRIWGGCDRLGMTEGIAGLDVGTDLPAWGPERAGGFRMLAARHRPVPVDSAELFEVFAFVAHDTVGLVACLAPNREDAGAGAWKTLLAEWQAIEGDEPPPEGMLGQVRVFLALGSHDLPLRILPATQVPSLGAQGARPFVTAQGFSLWEGPEERMTRTFSVIGPRSLESELDAWLWWAGPTALCHFAAYHLHAAKLRYEHRVYEHEVGRLYEIRQEFEQDVGQLMSLLDRTEDDGAVTSEQLLRAQERLIRSQTRSTGLLFSISLLHDLQRTVNIAKANMRALTPPSQPESQESPTSPFARDSALADWLNNQIEQDLAYAEAVRERASEAQRLAGFRLQQAIERHARAQEYLLLLQTALLSALIAVLTAIDILKLSVPVRASLRGPIVALVLGFALALPPLLVHWHERYRWFDRFAAGALGASVAWFALSRSWLLAAPNTGPPWAVRSAVLIGALAGIGATFAIDRSARMRHPRRGGR